MEGLATGALHRKSAPLFTIRAHFHSDLSMPVLKTLIEQQIRKIRCIVLAVCPTVKVSIISKRLAIIMDPRHQNIVQLK